MKREVVRRIISAASSRYTPLRRPGVGKSFRRGHIDVFALWIGGVTWHTFVVLPPVRTSSSVAGGIKSQARRFRRRLPMVIVGVFGTGIYQAIRLLGHSVSVRLGTSLGRLVTVTFRILLVLIRLVAINRPQAQHSGHPH